jgi:predicted ATP-grasp superfamily ATP-dependent carboligase
MDLSVPDVLAEPEAWAGAVAEICSARGVTLLLPITEASMLAVLTSRPELRNLVPFPDLSNFAAISDKGRVLQVAPSVGIAIPGQAVLRHPGDVQGLDLASLGYPLVIKPSRSVNQEGNHRIKLSVVHVATAADLSPALATLPPSAYPLLLQQRIVGPGIGVFLLVWDGRILAQFCHRRIREKPPAGGVSVYRESIVADPILIERSKALLDHFDWRGVAMVEYKVDEETGTPYLMEINGRFWGSLQLAIDSGVNFPVLLAAAASGDHPAPVTRYRTGVRSRWWWGDVDHLLARVRRSARMLGLPPGAPGRLRAAVEFLKIWRPGDRNEVFRLSDPAPFFRETIEWFQAL